MNYIKYLVLMFMIIFSNSYVYSEFIDQQAVCCFSNFDSSIRSGDLIRLSPYGECRNSGGITLGLPRPDESPQIERSSISQRINTACTYYVTGERGRECILASGSPDRDNFYFIFGDIVYPQPNSCQSIDECTGDCSWQSTEVAPPPVDDEPPELPPPVLPPPPVVPPPVIEEIPVITDLELGLSPFPIANRDLCETPRGPFRGALTSKFYCEMLSDDCVYDPLRAGVITQRVGDSLQNNNLFSTFESDIMCVSKFNSIRSCEDINSKHVCENYMGLQPNEESLMHIYGCEWRELNDFIGTCITKDLYFEDVQDTTSKSINIQNAIYRSNFIKNPIFELENDGVIRYWNGNFGIVPNNVYNGLLGSNAVTLQDSDDYLIQQISGIPINSNLEVVIVLSPYSSTDSSFVGIDAFIDNNPIILKEGYPRPLFSSSQSRSNLLVYVYEFPNTISDSTRNFSINSRGIAHILGVSINLISGDTSSTLENNAHRISSLSQFPQNSFNCDICSLSLFPGLCSEQNLNEFGNCELLSESNSKPYRWGISTNLEHREINPYESHSGMESIFIEEDMAFCGLYTTQDSCLNPNNKLNSQIRHYHSTNHPSTLCKWASAIHLPNGGICFKDSNNNNVPDTVDNGIIPYIRSSNTYSPSNASYYKLNSNGLNDFQLSCDSIPPSLFIEMYKTYVDGEGNLRNGSTLHIDPSFEGVIRRIHVRIDNQISQACSVFEDFAPNLQVLLFNQSDRISPNTAISAASLFSGFNNGDEVFQSTYSFSDFRSRLIQVSDLTPSNVDEFLRNGSMRLIDASGNLQKNTVNLRAGAGVGIFDFELELLPKDENGNSLDKLYSFSTVEIREISTPVVNPSWEETCQFSIYDNTNGQNISTGELLFLNFELNAGEIISNYVDNSAIEGDIEVFISATCSNYFGENPVSVSLLPLMFTNQDKIIFYYQDSDARRNSQGNPYLDIDSYFLPIKLEALTGVSCPQTSLLPIETVGSQDPLELGTTEFSSVDGAQDYTLQNDTGIDIRGRSSLSETDSILDGIYEIRYDCDFFEQDSFSVSYVFEVNTEEIDLSQSLLLHEDNSQWEIFNDMIYVNVSSSKQLVSQGGPETGDINSYIQSNLILSIEESIKNSIHSLKICDVNVNFDSDIITINDPILSSVGESECSVRYNEEFSYLELDTLVQVESIWGTTSEHLITTILEMHNPQMSITTSDGGQLKGDNLFFSNQDNNPTINIAMNLEALRGFSCEVQPVVNGDSGSYESSSFNSISPNTLDFRISDLNIGQDIINVIEVIDFRLEIDCRETLFQKGSSKSVRLVKDTLKPEITSISFLNSQGENLTYSWPFPTMGGNSDDPELQLRGDVEISFSNVNPYVSCDITPFLAGNPQGFISVMNSFTQESEDTNKLVFEDVLLVARQGVSTDPFILVDSTSSVDLVKFNVSAVCRGGGGAFDSNNDTEIQIQLFDFSNPKIDGEINQFKTLNLEIDSVISLSSFSITIRDELRDVQLFSGPISSTDHQISNIGTITRLNIRSVDIGVSDLEEREKYPLHINLSSGDSFYMESYIEVIVDNTNPSVQIELPINELGIIHQNQLTGSVLFDDLPSFSKGIREVSIGLYQGATYIDSIELNLEDNPSEILSGQVALREIDNFESLDSNHYRLNVEVIDFYGNTNQTSVNFFVSDAVEIELLDSSNVGIFELDRNTWYTNSLKPHLRFTSINEFDSCTLRPGPTGGYNGQSIQFQKLGENFELNLESYSSSQFTILEGKRQIQIVCNEPDETEHIFAVYLYKLDAFHDYVIDIDWGKHQLVPSNQDSKIVNFSITQKSLFTDVTCELDISGGNYNNLIINPSSSNGNYRGSVELTPQSQPYTFELKCLNPLQISGPVKSYLVTVEKVLSDYNEILSVRNDQLGFNYEITGNNIRLPNNILTQTNGELKVLFTNRYQGELNCDIDTTQSGIVNFILSLFRNTRVSATPVLQSLYEGTVQIDASTTSIRIRCVDDQGSFTINEQTPYTIEFIDPSQFRVGEIQTQGVR